MSTASVADMNDDLHGCRAYTRGMAAPLKTPQIDGFWLREWRIARGITQEQVAEALDTHKSVISNYERGKREPGVAVILRLASAIGVHPGDLFRAPDDVSLDALTVGLPQDARAHIAHTVAALAESLRR